MLSGERFYCDESNVPRYELPVLLQDVHGEPVRDAADWWHCRRPELVSLLEQYVYGATPTASVDVSGSLLQEDRVLDGAARQRLILLTITHGERRHEVPCLLYLPTQIQKPVPVFVGLNFSGLHTVTEHPDMPLPMGWVRSEPDLGAGANRASDSGRGGRRRRWPIDTLVREGFGVATAYCGDFAPDDILHYQKGVWSLFDGPRNPRHQEQWGAVGMWAWGLSRILDYLEQEPAVDWRQTIVFGHSRLGKAALWAGAQDERFAMVISNNSGCGGAAISRRRFGETIAKINRQFPHWFCERFRNFNESEERLPVDQHMLLALAAPRPLYVASASEDLWADPKGEYLAACAAASAYALLGQRVLLQEEMPLIGHPVCEGSIGYHIRSGGHGITDYDWSQYVAFAKHHLTLN